MSRGYGGFSIEYSNAKRTQEKVEKEVNSLPEEEFLRKYREYNWWRDNKNIYGKYATARFEKIEQQKYYERNPGAEAKENADAKRRTIKFLIYMFGLIVLGNSDSSPVIFFIYTLGVPIFYFPIKMLIRKVMSKNKGI